jgi:hypothetical protein
VRGFVYQVDLTIDRWLHLQAGDVLELERGEDVDLVTQSLAASPDQYERLLEQVKHRVTPISLLSPPAIAALACAVEHRKANPGMNLAFRYTTNARITGERLSLIKPTAPAITLWEELRTGRVLKATQEQYLTQIRAILKSGGRPGDLNRATWNAFREFLTQAGDDELLDLVSRFEWSTESPEAEQQEPQIRQLLVSLRHASDDANAKQQYQRLFLYVFKLLTRPDLKRLTFDDLLAQLSLPTLSESDRALLGTLTRRLDELEARVSSLERRVTEHSAAIVSVESRVNAITKAQGIQAAIDFTTVNPLLDLPPLVNLLSHRKTTVDATSNHLKTHTWLALVGSAGVGKTQLGLLIAIKHGNCRAWMRCRELTVEQCYSRFGEMYEALTGIPFTPTNSSWLKTLSSCLEPGSMLAFDDLPRLSGEDEFSHCLMALVHEFEATGMKLISTSHYSLPPRVSDAVTPRLLISVDSPMLQDEEAAEILAAYGAPKALLTKEFVRYVNAQANQNPTLLAAAAKYLAKRRWKFTSTEFTALMRGQHTREVRAEVVNRLLHMFDERSRELLYRFNLTWGSFSYDDVDLLAKVEPAVARAREILHELTGLWLQQDTHDSFLVSPLIRTLGEDFLDEQARHGCHVALGKRILRKREVTPLDVREAFAHFVSAKDVSRAAVLILQAFRSMLQWPHVRDDYGLLDIWNNQPLGVEIALAMRIYLRSLHIAARQRVGKDIDYLLHDLDALVGEAKQPEGWAVIAAAITLSANLSGYDPIRANRYLITGLKLSPDALGPDGEKLELPHDLRPEWLLWINAEEIKNPTELRDWMNSVEYLTTEQREYIFAGRDGEQGSMALADNLWLQESEKPKEAQQWNQICESLDDLVQWSRNLGLEILWACGIRAKMIVEAEYKGSQEAARELAESALSEASSDPRVRFLIKDTLGMQYWYAKQSALALLWLDDAQTERTDAFPLMRVDGLLSASCAVGDSDAEKAIRYAESAYEIAKSEKTTKGKTIRTMGELAIAQWLAGRDLATVFSVCDEAAERLLSAKRDADSWKQLFIVFAHTSGYLCHLASRGKPPPEGMDGESYAPPKRGAFLMDNKALVTLYDPAKELFLTVQLAMFASGVKNDDRAVSWALQGIDTARERKQHVALPLFGYILVPHLLKTNRYTDALDLALEASAIMVAGSIQINAGGKALGIGPGELDVGSLLGQKPSDSWRKAEELSLATGLLPAAFRIGTVALLDAKARSTNAAEVAEACRRIGANASAKDLWTSAADVIELAFVHRISGRDLVQMVNRFEDETLRMIAYIGASLCNDFPLQSVCEAHLVAVHYAHKTLGSTYPVYRQIVLPFVSDYWLKILHDRHSHSIPPSPVLRAIAKIPSIPEEKRAQAILAIAARNLRATVTPSQGEWLMEGVNALQSTDQAS